MSATDPYVSVFHFTTKISSAKIRKYKLATEKGMGPSGVSGRTPTPTPGPGKIKPAPSPEVDTTTAERPAKRPRIKLNVRNPSQDSQSQSPDTIAVSQPARKQKARDAEDMEVDIPEVNGTSTQQKPRAPSAASSELSSLSSLSPLEQEPTPATETESVNKPKKTRDYSRDFMSYYVDGGDEGEGDDDEIVEAPTKTVSKPAPKPEQPPQAAPIIQPPRVQAQRPPFPPQPPRETRFKNHTGPPLPYPTSARERPAVPRPKGPPPPPVVHVVNNIKIGTGPREPDTVANMIEKLKVLSDVLTMFGGSLPPEPSPAARPTQLPPTKSNLSSSDNAGQSKTAAANLLAMFDDEDDSDGKESSIRDDEDEIVREERQAQDRLKQPLKATGTPDAQLTFGIQFIQHALSSWAQQRLQNEYTQYYYTRHNHAQQQAQQQKRGPGRPRKFDDEEDLIFSNLPSAVVQVDLSTTEEGRAMKAFQAVHDSGCLQMNVFLPVELSRMLRRIYYQIDKLINRGAIPPEANWECMSYGAQIMANRSRVDEWKEARARALAEMQRQQLNAQQQGMQQMSIHTSQVPMTQAQIQQLHAVDLERKRAAQQAAQQPHLSGSLANPIPLADGGSEAVGISNPSVPSSDGSTSANAASATKGGQTQALQTKGNGVQHLDKAKLQMPNYLPRSGQSMKFSFAPHNELALKAFGPEAFPSNRKESGHPGSRTRSTGSTSGVGNSSPSLPNGASPPAVTAANLSTPKLTNLNRESSDTIQVASKPNTRRASQAASAEDRPRLSISNGSAAFKSNKTPEDGDFSTVRTPDQQRASTSRPASASSSKPLPDDKPSDATPTTNGTTASASPTLGQSSATPGDGASDKRGRRIPRTEAVVVIDS